MFELKCIVMKLRKKYNRETRDNNLMHNAFNLHCIFKHV